MNILSLDLSTHSSGWAYFEDKELKKYGCINSSSTDLIKRIYKMTEEIYNILSEYNKVEKIIIEEVRPETENGIRNLKTYRALMWLQASVAFLIHDKFENIKIEYVYPSSWRAILGIKNGRGIKRDSLKLEDISFIKEKYNIEVNDDIADAICIGLSQINKQDISKEDKFIWE